LEIQARGNERYIKTLGMSEPVPDRGVDLHAVNVSFLLAAMIATVLRCYTRIVIVRAFGLDDWAMLFATVRLSVPKEYWKW
jgi:hypothetical protein